jgi:hypothetical protein
LSSEALAITVNYAHERTQSIHLRPERKENHERTDKDDAEDKDERKC